MSLSSFRHAVPGLRVYYGNNCLDQLAAEMRRLGRRRAVIFSGRTLANADPGLRTLQAALGELCAGTFDAVGEHSPIPAVLAAVETLRRLDADAVVALGGGSAVVTARAATILLGENKDVRELCTRFVPGQAPVSPKLVAPKLPQFLVPTTPTTACSRAGAAVLDPELGQRLSLFDPKARPEAIFFHPGLFSAAPAKVAMDASLNAFTMAIQGLESARREPLADAMLLHAIRLMRRRLPELAQPASSADGRGELMLAGLLAGQGTDYTGLGLAAALGHSIGARFSVGNGLVNAIVLPHTIRFNGPATGDRLEDALAALRARIDETPEHPAEGVSRSCSRLFEQLGIPQRLRDVGVGKSDLPQIAEDVKGDWFLSQNPRGVEQPDLLDLLSAAW
jgi:alcohol dehydrogenase class IV